MFNPQDKQRAGDQTGATKEEKNQLVFSYLTLRNLIGFSGILLPFILAVAPARPSDYYGFEPSISDYYYTDRGDLLVVTLSIMGTFLITYRGYNWKERALTLLAGICAIGIAFVPTKKDCLECALSVHTGNGGIFGFIVGTRWHFTLSATFLLCLALMSLVFFPKSDHKTPLRMADGQLSQKAKRNYVYSICGWIIIVCLIFTGLIFLIQPDLGKIPVLFFLESIAVIAFGISWITKGQTLWPDGEHYIIKGVRNLMTSQKI